MVLLRLLRLSAMTLVFTHLATCAFRIPPVTWDEFLGSENPIFPPEINKNFTQAGGLSQPDSGNGVLIVLQGMLDNPETSKTLHSNFLRAYGKGQSRQSQSSFKETLMAIGQQNVLYYTDKSSWSEGVNFFADMSKEEFSEFLGEGPGPNPGGNVGAPWTNRTTNANVPGNLDWRAKDYVSQIKNQGRCDSCWAFASIAAVEINIAIKSEGASKPVLSEQELVSCFKRSCDGEFPYKAMDYIRNKGLALESDYPYTSGNTGQASECQAHPVAGKVSGYETTRDETAMKSMLAEVGPVVIGVYYSSAMARHKDGVFDGPCGTDGNGGPGGYHAVTIVGYGEEDGSEYWIIRNSHGTGCCDKGYIKLRRNADKCGVSSYLGALLPIV